MGGLTQMKILKVLRFCYRILTLILSLVNGELHRNVMLTLSVSLCFATTSDQRTGEPGLIVQNSRQTAILDRLAPKKLLTG